MWVVQVLGGPQLWRLSHILLRVQEGSPRWDGLRESVARSSGIVKSSPGHELRELAEPCLCDIEVSEEPNKIKREKKDRGVLFHRLHLLSTNKGGVTNVRGLQPWGPGQGR